MIPTLAVLLVLGAFGAHPAVLWRLARRTSEERRLGLLSLGLLLGTALLPAALRLRLSPDILLAAGWGSGGIEARVLRAAAVLILALAAVDLLLLWGWRGLEAAGYRVAAGFSLLPLAAVCAAEELLRAGQGPGAAVLPGALLAAVLCRAVVALGAGEALAPRSPGKRPLWALPGGLALLVWTGLLPPPVRGAMLAGGEPLTLAAAAGLWLAAPWVPARLRRPAQLAGALLAGLWLARGLEVSASLGLVAPLAPVP